MTYTIDPCPRCGGRHEHMGFIQFTNPHPAGFTYFAMCPVKNEPVLWRTRPDGERPVIPEMVAV